MGWTSNFAYHSQICMLCNHYWEGRLSLTVDAIIKLLYFCKSKTTHTMYRTLYNQIFLLLMYVTSVSQNFCHVYPHCQQTDGYMYVRQTFKCHGKKWSYKYTFINFSTQLYHDSSHLPWSAVQKYHAFLISNDFQWLCVTSEHFCTNLTGTC